MPTSSGQERGRIFIDFNKSILTTMGIGKVLPLLYSPPQLLSQTLLQDLSTDTNPRNSTQPLNRVQNNPFRNRQTRLSVDRPVDRPYAPVDRA